MAPYPLNRLDDLVGETIERAVRAHHARRLRRRGSAEAIDPPPDGGWARTASFAPRAGCRVEPFLDGAEALPRIADAIRSARSPRPSRRLALRRLVPARARKGRRCASSWPRRPSESTCASSPGRARRCRSSTRTAARCGRRADELAGGTRITMALDARERPFHCHHEKLVVVDDETAFVGGIDLTALSGDRLDSNDHPARDGLGWHDTAVRLEGPVVGDVARHFHARWHTVARDGLPEPGAPPAVDGGIEAQFVRTVPERLYEPWREGEWSILESYLRALRSAERFVYLESQFLWSPEVVFVLAEKLRRPPSRRLPRDRAAPVSAEQRRRRQSRAGRDPDRRRQGVRRRHAALPRLHALPARAGGQPGLRPLEGGDRRRRVAHDRLGEPQRALALQRHRGERRRPRPGAGARGAAAAVGGAPRAAARGDRRRPRARVRRAVEAARRGALRAAEARRLGRREADAAAHTSPAAPRRCSGR